MCWSMCHCWVLHLNRVCLCVGGIIYGKTTQLCHLANIWTSAPHLTVRIEADEITGSLIETHSYTNTHAHFQMHEHTLNNARNTTELAAGLNGF